MEKNYVTIRQATCRLLSKPLKIVFAIIIYIIIYNISYMNKIYFNEF